MIDENILDFAGLADANKHLNAFTELDRTTSGGEGTLAGKTVGVKTNIAVKGMHWTAGMALYRDRIAERDAEVVRQLREAGAAIIGMCNMEEAALGAKTNNPFFGATQNPHRIGFTPGGSSGGSGAAVAAGLCDIALGTDTMGSVRVPSAYCGVYGFKPAQSSISKDGLELCEPSLDCIGPMARSLELLEATSKILIPFRKKQGIEKIGLLENLGGVELEMAVGDAYRNAAGKFAGSSEFSLPYPLSRVRFAGFIKTSRFLAAHFANALKMEPELFSDHFRQLMNYGPKRSAEDFAEDERILSETASVLNKIVEDMGAVLLPTTPQPAFDHQQDAPPNQADFTCLANVADLPAISIPAGWTDDGLPVGIQLIGARSNEGGLFDMAHRLDAQLGAYRPPEYFYQG